MCVGLSHGFQYKRFNIIFVISENCIWYIFTNPSAQAGCNTRSIFDVWFNRLTYTGCHTKAKEPNLLNYLTHSRRKDSWIHSFHLGITAMPNTNILVRNLNSSHRVHFLSRYPWHHERLQDCLVWVFKLASDIYTSLQIVHTGK